jgi:foldase protein PrsA
VAAAAALAGCGGGGARPAVVARIGGQPISKTSLTHWMFVLAPQHVVPDPPHYAACIARLKALAPRSVAATSAAECRKQHRALTQRALAFLVSTAWLVGEAADKGLRVSAAEVERRLEQKRRSFPNGEAEFQDSLKAIAHTLGDLKLEVEAELATGKIRQAIAESEPQITQTQLVAYYTRNLARYHTSERRYFDLVQTFMPGPNAKREIEEAVRGKSLAQVGRHESLRRSQVAGFRGKENTLGAVFAARPHVVTGPLLQDGHYFIFEVTRVVPPRRVPFASVRRSIARQLAGEQRRPTLARFISAWRRKWIARTDCARGFAIQKCRQYGGPPAPEDPLRLE